MGLRWGFETTSKDHDEKIQAIFEAIQQLISLPDDSKKKIGFTAKETKKSHAQKPAKKKQPTGKSAKK